MPDLERCTACDTWLDPAALDEVLFHALGACLAPGSAVPATGIRGEKTDEPPQG